MPVYRSALFGFVALFAALVAPRNGVALTLGEKAELQAAMQRHIERSMVDDVILQLDPQSGEIRHLHPVTAHPMILSMGPHYILCFDFRDDNGKSVPVDYYMARKGDDYVVFHSAFNDRSLLHRLIEEGQVKRQR